MPEVEVKKGEPVDRALKRLKNILESEGILEEIRRRRAFETPTKRTLRKARANSKRSRQRVRFNYAEFRKERPESVEEAAEAAPATATEAAPAEAETPAATSTAAPAPETTTGDAS